MLRCKPTFERPDLFVQQPLNCDFMARLETKPHRTHGTDRTHGPMGSWEGKICSRNGALSTNRSFQFFKPAEVANFGGDEKNKGGKFPPNSKFCWILKGIIYHIFQGCFALQNKTRRTYVQPSRVKKSTPERIPLLQKILTQLWPENPTFPPKKNPQPWNPSDVSMAGHPVFNGPGGGCPRCKISVEAGQMLVLISSNAVQF